MRTKTKQQLLVEKFCGAESKINWPREIKLANFLLDLHGEEIFRYIVLGWNSPSLAYFKTADGKKVISAAKIEMEKLKKTEPKPFEENFVYTNTAPVVKSLSDRLKK